VITPCIHEVRIKIVVTESLTKHTPLLRSLVQSTACAKEEWCLGEVLIFRVHHIMSPFYIVQGKRNYIPCICSHSITTKNNVFNACFWIFSSRLRISRFDNANIKSWSSRLAIKRDPAVLSSLDVRNLGWLTVTSFWLQQLPPPCCRYNLLKQCNTVNFRLRLQLQRVSKMSLI